MDVGILGGTGPLGRGLALRFAGSGLKVALGSRDAKRASEVATELKQRYAQIPLSIDGLANADAARCDLVVAATPWDALVSTVLPLADELAGKVVVSVANALIRHGREMHALIPASGSMAGELQGALPRSKVVAAGHHLPASSLEALHEAIEADVLVCADHAADAEVVCNLFGRVDGLRPLVAGSLGCAGAVESFTAVLISINMRYRAHSTLRLGGVKA